MEDLSRELGITKSAIYHHVTGKEELLRLAISRALDGLFAVAAEVEAMGGASERSSGPGNERSSGTGNSGPGNRAIDRLEHLVRGSVGVLAEQLPFVTLLLRVRGNTKTERDALARRREFDRFTADLVKQAVAEGDVRPDIDPAITARLLFGLVNSLVEWYRPQRGSASRQRGSADRQRGSADRQRGSADRYRGTGAGQLADAVCTIAFDGLRVTPAAPETPESGDRDTARGRHPAP